MPSLYKFIPDSFWLQNKAKIDQWMSQQYSGLIPPVYCSIDVRSAGFKTAHVDANLFPAGFNNIHSSKTASVTESFDSYISRNFPSTAKILIITEDFTRNLHYLKNVSNLISLLNVEGRECRSSPINQRLVNKEGIIYADGWQPDLILLNCDLSSGIPQVLRETTQVIIPSPHLGWHSRSKYKHFLSFQKLIDNFSQYLGIDSWLLSTYYDLSSDVDFKQKIGLDDLASKTDKILSLTRDKYQQYGISEHPHVFVKSDHGTFGAGIMTATSGDDILNINKKNRHTMQTINHGIVNSSLLVQEGVPTSLDIFGAAEYAYYLIGGKAQFRILRQNSSKDKFGNLNSKGMQLTADADMPYGIECILAEIAALATLFEPL